MRFTVIAISALASASLSLAGPTSVHRRGSNSSCSSPPTRKEWRTLTATEKQAYIDAVLCLQNQTAISGFSDALNRYDDFHAVHHDQTPAIHWVGHFALWHRYFVAEYEKTLIDVCGYTGGQPYWNWSMDANPDDLYSTAIFETDIFSNTSGFGGNGPYVPVDAANDPFNFTGFGRTGGGCVPAGPLVKPYFSVNVNQSSPGTCLKRDFTPYVMNWFADPANVDYVQSQPDYTSFAYALEGVPAFTQPNIHGSGHFGVGGALGQIGDAYNSPGDPLFYLHHGNLDRVLWEWQQKDLSTRLNEVGGPITPFDYGGVNVTLNFTVNLGNIAGKVTLKDLLDIEGDTLCYTYDA